MDKQQEIDCLRAKCQRHQEEHEKACEKMAKQNMVINELKQELESLRQEKSDAIQKCGIRCLMSNRYTPEDAKNWKKKSNY